MKIIIDRNNDFIGQHPLITIDTDYCHFPYSIRQAIETALRLDGNSEQIIDEIFNRNQQEATPDNTMTTPQSE